MIPSTPFQPGITFLRLGHDEVCWRLEIHATNGAYMATVVHFTNPVELEAFARALLTFPRDLHDEVRLEDGAQADPHYHYHFLIRAFICNGRGHSALEFSTRLHPEEFLPSSARFYLMVEASAINRLGRQLLSWITHAESPLCWHCVTDS